VEIGEARAARTIARRLGLGKRAFHEHGFPIKRRTWA
jgi:hypothetical protein